MFRLLIFFISSILLGGCSETCRNTIISQTASPDRKYDAMVFHRDCGARTGVFTQISIISSGDLPLERGNAFRADDNDGAAQIGRRGHLWVEVKWLSSDHLLVRFAENARLFKQDFRVSGVKIDYESVAF
jgi:hypothetical protein